MPKYLYFEHNIYSLGKPWCLDHHALVKALWYKNNYTPVEISRPCDKVVLDFVDPIEVWKRDKNVQAI